MLATVWLMLRTMLYSLQLNIGSFPKSQTDGLIKGISTLDSCKCTHLATYDTGAVPIIRADTTALKQNFSFRLDITLWKSLRLFCRVI